MDRLAAVSAYADIGGSGAYIIELDGSTGQRPHSYKLHYSDSVVGNYVVHRWKRGTIVSSIGVSRETFGEFNVASTRISE